MVSLYVTSVEEGAGKTTICAGLGRYLQESGQRIGFFKPVVGQGRLSATEAPEPDAVFMKQILGLEEPVESISPVMADWNQLLSGLKGAYARVATGKEVVKLRSGQ